MLNEQTVEKLHGMKLFGMAEGFRGMSGTPLKVANPA